MRVLAAATKRPSVIETDWGSDSHGIGESLLAQGGASGDLVCSPTAQGGAAGGAVARPLPEGGASGAHV
jgi:hypothetical protein